MLSQDVSPHATGMFSLMGILCAQDWRSGCRAGGLSQSERGMTKACAARQRPGLMSSVVSAFVVVAKIDLVRLVTTTLPHCV